MAFEKETWNSFSFINIRALESVYLNVVISIRSSSQIASYDKCKWKMSNSFTEMNDIPVKQHDSVF